MNISKMSNRELEEEELIQKLTEKDETIFKLRRVLEKLVYCDLLWSFRGGKPESVSAIADTAIRESFGGKA